MRNANENTVSSKNQLPVTSERFYLGNEKAKHKVLIIGNSITRHGPKPEPLGWYGDWGMAASAPECDYVHLLASYLEKDGIDAFTFVRQAVVWERGHNNPDILSELKLENEFCADVVVFRLGENIKDFENLEENLYKLIKFICPSGKVIFATTVWKCDVVNAAITAVAGRMGECLVDITAVGKEDKYMALDKFSHPGVAMHPGDEGMKYIADKIYPELKKLLS